MDNKRRIYVQPIDMHTNQQVWSKMYESMLTDENLFLSQDEIVKRIIADLKV
jgi:TolB-like protein